MRNTLITSNLIFLFLALFFWWRSCNKTQTVLPPVTDNTQCGSCMGYNNSGLPDSELDFNLVQTMTHGYQSVPANNTRSLWLSLDVLKQFIWRIENNTCGCKGKLGVRIYEAKYPTATTGWNVFSQDLGSLPVSYQGINTFVMIPTIESGGINRDFNPKANSGCLTGYNPVLFPPVHSDSAASFNSHTASSSILALTIEAQNHGEACPPPFGTCPGRGAFFDY